jgi:hypothetical protein
MQRQVAGAQLHGSLGTRALQAGDLLEDVDQVISGDVHTQYAGAAGLACRLARLGDAALPAVGGPRLHHHERRDLLAHQHHRFVYSPLLRGGPPRTEAPTEPTTAPTGVAIFAEDFQSVRRFSERDHANIVRWKHYQRGSHFSPHDAPDLLLGDIREFFRPLR